jgi:hypothetical protein
MAATENKGLSANPDPDVVSDAFFIEILKG